MMPIMVGAKYFDMVHRHYTEVLIHLEDGIEADQATAFRQLTWIGVVYMFYCFYLTSDWFWHQILGFPLFLATVIAEETLVNDKFFGGSRSWDSIHFALTMMGYFFTIAFTHYYVHKIELELLINYQFVDNERKQLQEVLQLLPQPVIIVSKEKRRET
jgi:hypothetical protein